jgi:hypothetical protein
MTPAGLCLVLRSCTIRELYVGRETRANHFKELVESSPTLVVLNADLEEEALDQEYTKNLIEALLACRGRVVFEINATGRYKVPHTLPQEVLERQQESIRIVEGVKAAFRRACSTLESANGWEEYLNV